MFIHDLAQASGVSAKTIRYYESIGLLPAPPRAENNYRQYGADALERLRFIVSASAVFFDIFFRGGDGIFSRRNIFIKIIGKSFVNGLLAFDIGAWILRESRARARGGGKSDC